MNPISSPPEFYREVLIKLDNGLFVVGQFHRLSGDGFSHDYFTVGKGIYGFDRLHMTGKPVEWCYLP